MNKRYHSRLLPQSCRPAKGSARPCIDLLPESPEYPIGWFLIRIKLNKPSDGTRFLLHARSDHPERLGQICQEFEFDSSGRFGTILKVFHPNQHFALEQLKGDGNFQIKQASLQRLSKVEAGIRLLLPRLFFFLNHPRRLLKALRKLAAIAWTGGWTGIKARLRDEVVRQDTYASWIAAYDTLTATDRAAIRQRISRMPSRPLISVLMPVYNVDERWLRAAIESVRTQLYDQWELCIADDHSTLPHIRNVLEEFVLLDPRIKVVFRPVNGHISEASNSALSLVTGSFVALLDHDDVLAEHALYRVAEEILEHPQVDLIYSDEDKLDESDRRFEAHFKPDWNPDLCLSLNLVTHLAVFRTALVREVGGFRKGFEGSQDYDLLLRVVEKTEASRIRHIPEILYHWRAIQGSVALGPSEKNYAHEAARRAIQEHLDRTRTPAHVMPGFGSYHRVQYEIPAPAPLVTLIVCTRDRLELLKTIVDGILHETDYPAIELIIVNNQSREAKTLAYFKKVAADSRVRILDFDAPFNFSAMNNLGARQAKGKILGFINNDLKVISADWLREMVSHVIRPGIGAVGALLYFPSETVQHAGIIMGIGGIAGHAHKGLSRYSAGYIGRAKVIYNVSGVTGACMLVPRAVFEEVGGLDEVNLPVAFNDVDLSLKIRAAGYRIVFTPYAELYHFESATRGSDGTPENKPRFDRESDFMKSNWGRTLLEDPNYNPNLTLTAEDLSPAFPPRVKRKWD